MRKSYFTDFFNKNKKEQGQIISHSVEKMDIPLIPLIGYVRDWDYKRGWFYNKKEDRSELMVSLSEKILQEFRLVWNPKRESYTIKINSVKRIIGRDYLYENKKKYILFNLNVLTKQYMKLIDLTEKGFFNQRL